ncbi:hypothetical protein ACFL3G_02605 [Planctomycetota bacterium]
MMPNKTYEIRNLYFQQSQYSAKKDDKKYDHSSLLQWPSNGYFEKLKPDADLLHKVLWSENNYKGQTVSEQIFGSQIKQQSTSLKHIANLFYERCQLHKNHIRDIDHSHIKIQESLFGVKINNFPDQARRQSNLEGQLLQLESQRREEELTFWKDTVELREKLFEGAGQYKAARDRCSVFYDVEAEYGR